MKFLTLILTMQFTISANTYIVDCTTLQSRAQLAQFVDDGAFWIKGSSPLKLVKDTQKVMNILEAWSNKWGFTINPSKTQVILFEKDSKQKKGSKPMGKRLKKPEIKLKDLPKLELCGQTLEYQTEVKFLGMFFDRFLKWS